MHFKSFEYRVPLKPVQGGVASAAHFDTGHELCQSNRVCFCPFLDVLLAFKGSNQSEPIPYCSMKFYFTLLHNRDALPFNR